jgi:hypothetical protein
MPRPQKPFDTAHYERMKAEGFSDRAIARAMRIPLTTFQTKVKAHHTDRVEGPPRATHGKAIESTAIGIPQSDKGIPPLYVHPGIPDDSQENPVGAEDIPGVHHGIPALPGLEIPQVSPGLPSAAISPELAEALTATWPDLVDLVTWWRARHQAGQEPNEKLERATYHVAPRWIEAVRREADKTGESYAAVVNRAFAQYFAGKST